MFWNESPNLKIIFIKEKNIVHPSLMLNGEMLTSLSTQCTMEKYDGYTDIWWCFKNVAGIMNYKKFFTKIVCC